MSEDYIRIILEQGTLGGGFGFRCPTSLPLSDPTSINVALKKSTGLNDDEFSQNLTIEGSSLQTYRNVNGTRICGNTCYYSQSS